MKATAAPRIVRQIERRRNAVSETLESAFSELNPRALEQLSNVMAMFKEEDADWFQFGEEAAGGLSLHDLKRWSKEIRESLVGNPHIKRGAELRSDYIWDGGIRYGGTRGAKRHIDNPMNEHRFFSAQARQERYRACYSDGIVLYLGNDKTKEIEAAVPLSEIQSLYRNAQNPSEIWAYLRVWHDYSNPSNPVEKRRWIFTDLFKSKMGKRKTINHDGKPVQVERQMTMFDGHVNTQTGWALGVPHALAALVWARLYRDFLVNGKVMSDAMAQFAFQLTTNSATGTAKASMKFAQPGGSGQTVVSPNELAPLATAGKSYDFDSGRALASVVATSIGVSVIHLTSDPGTAGSSYGSAQTLDLPTRLSVSAERDWNKELDLRVLRWMGAAKPTATFKSLIAATDQYRELQALKLAWDTGAFEPGPLRDLVAEILGIVDPGKIPEGILIPNNEKTARINKPASSSGGSGGDEKGPQAGAPGQGQSTGAGKGPKSNDSRDDTDNPNPKS